MTKARGALSLLLLLAAGLVLAPLARADSQARIVRLSLVSGPVQIDRAGGAGFEKAIMNMPIAQGMKLWTQGDSRAEVEFEDGATMRLTPGAKVDFEQLALLSSGAKASTVQINAGSVYFNIPKKGENDFRVAFGGQQLSLTRSVHFRVDVTSDRAEIAVFKGELALNGPKEEKVKKDQTARLDLSDQASYQVAKGIAPSPFDEWDTYRLQFENLYASAGSKNVPYSYGRSDLNYYGSWGYVPGYGNLWRPFGYGYGWDPFYDGAWAWYPGWGYTWVSSYPWGWIPYRYGSWVWAGNYGWCWRPGGYSNWYAVRAVINPPPAFKPPQPPPVTAVAGPQPPTIVVGSGPRGPRTRFDADGNPVPIQTDAMRPGVRTTTAAPVAAPGGASPARPAATASVAAPDTAQSPRPARTFVPASGPGMGRRPVPLDDSGVAVSPAPFGRARDDGARPGLSRQGLGAPPAPRSSSAQPPMPRSSGSHVSPTRPSAPSAPRTTAPPAAPRSTPQRAAPPSSRTHE